jgi:hypothetical protein
VATRAYWNAYDEISTDRDNALAALPEGSPGFKRHEIWEVFWTGVGNLESNELLDPANRPWFVGYKPPRLVWNDIEAFFWHTAMSGLSEYNPDQETYPEFLARKEQFLVNDLPMIVASSNVLWERLDSIEYLDPSMAIEDIGARLLLIANPEGYDAYYKRIATLDDALFRVWEDNYWSEYWESVEGKSNEDRAIAEREFYDKWSENPFDKTREVGPSEQQMVQWVFDAYGDRWTEQEILDAINPTIYSAEQRLNLKRAELLGEEGAQAEDRAFEILSSVPPGMMDEFTDAYLDHGGDDSFIDELYDQEVNISEDKLKEELPKLMAAQRDMGFTDISEVPRSELEERSLARSQNDEFKAWIDTQTYEGFYNEMSDYYNHTFAWQREKRNSDPEFAEALDMYSDLKAQYAESHPIWAKYYYTKPSSSSSGGGGSGGRSGGGSTRTTQAPYPYGVVPGPQPRPDIRIGKRSTLNARYLIRPGQIGRGGVGGKFIWPPDLRQEAGEDIVERVEEAVAVNPEKPKEELTEVEINYLDTLMRWKDNKYETFLKEILNEREELTDIRGQQKF